jgi:cytidylate kinase
MDKRNNRKYKKNQTKNKQKQIENIQNHMSRKTVKQEKRKIVGVRSGGVVIVDGSGEENEIVGWDFELVGVKCVT